jgi:dihydrofolate synthase/folylpolyglutamate synthase
VRQRCLASSRTHQSSGFEDGPRILGEFGYPNAKTLCHTQSFCDHILLGPGMSDSRDGGGDAAHQFLLGRINYERADVMPYGERSFKLDRMRELLRRLGDPQDGMAIIHIAGTKGKGSTAAMTAAMLTAAGYRTGLYHSPHLERVEERIMIDGRPCPADEFAELVEQMRPIALEMDAASPQAGSLAPTFFELTTALALLHFARRTVDAVVLEVGLGGRLDSTNVCRPRVSVITNISFDHTRLLGKTLAKIAGEKAGIIKPGVPVVSGVCDAEPRQVIEDAAAAAGSPLRQRGVDFDFTYTPPRRVAQSHARGTVDVRLRQPPARYEGLELNLLGRHQAANAALAVAALHEFCGDDYQVPESAIRRGLGEVRWPARVEVVSWRPAIVLDAAHNLASVQALVETLAESFAARRRVLIFGASGDKDVRGMLAAIVPHFDQVIFTRYVNNPRGVPPEKLARLSSHLETGALVCADPAAAWEAARQLLEPEDLLCITGSFFLAAEMRAAMSRRPLAASFEAATLPTVPASTPSDEEMAGNARYLTGEGLPRTT